MLVTDTDNVIYKIETQNVYENFYKNKELFDFNNYKKDPKYFDNLNDLVVYKIEDETFGVTKISIIRLKPKMVTYETEDSLESKKPKEIIKLLLMMN